MSIDKMQQQRMVIGRAMAFLIEIMAPNWIALWLYPSPNAMGLAFFLLIYLLFKDGIEGQSICKRMFRLMVIDQTTGKPCGPFKSFLRNLDMLLPFAPLVELLILQFSEDGRRLGDKLANTIVVVVEEEADNPDSQASA